MHFHESPSESEPMRPSTRTIGAMLASLMLLSVLTAVGPACLLASTFGMTMPMSSGSDASGQCDTGDSSTLSVCPYSAPQDVLGNSVKVTTPDVFGIPSGPEMTPDIVASPAPRAFAQDREPPSPVHLVPLRL